MQEIENSKNINEVKRFVCQPVPRIPQVGGNKQKIPNKGGTKMKGVKIKNVKTLDGTKGPNAAQKTIGREQ